MPESPQNRGLFRPPVPFEGRTENGGALPGADGAGNNEAQGSEHTQNAANGLRAPVSQPSSSGQEARRSLLSGYNGAPSATPLQSSNAAWSQGNAQNAVQQGGSIGNANTWDQTVAHPSAGQGNGWGQGAFPNGNQNNGHDQPPSSPDQTWNQNPTVSNGVQNNGWGQPASQQNAGPNNFNGSNNAPNGWQQAATRGPDNFNGANNAPSGWQQGAGPGNGQLSHQQNGSPNNFNGANSAPNGWQQGVGQPSAAPGNLNNNGWGQQAGYPGRGPGGPGPNSSWGMQGSGMPPNSAIGNGRNAEWNQAAAQGGKKRGLRAKYASLSTPKKIMLVVLVVALLIPSLLIIFEGINGLILYNQARSGLQHLQNAQAIFSGGPKGNTAKYLDVNKLRLAQVEVDAANNDFHQLSRKLDSDGSVGLLSSMLPKQIVTARSLAHIGADATEIAQQGIRSAITLSPTLTPALAHPLGGGNATSPIVTPPVLDELGHDFDFILPRLHDMQQYSKDVDPNSLPLSDSQRKLITTALPLLPVGEGILTQVRSNMDVLGWFLGVDQPRTFLVETMDRGELRATGGFTGQFGELELNGGRMAPLSLKNIGQFEEDNRSTGSPLDPIFAKVQGQAAPAPFTWWPIPNFGMRDANLSADFPTSAKLIMNQYKSEFGKQTDGLILFSPFLISHVLEVTGPISVPEYKETITAQNLEQRLHYYQLDNVGIRQEELVEHVEDPQIARKLFTKRLSGLLLAKVQALPSDKMISLGKEMLYAMKTKDLQLYFTNDKLEKLIGQYGSTAEIDRSTAHDGLFVVQANLSVSKASQYVTTSISDNVTLDAKGGATHKMKMKLVYNQTGPVYGLDTYRDYVRVYTPPNSQFISGTGFSHFGDPYCGGYYTPCPQREDLYGTGEMICPIGTKIGLIPALNDDPYGDRLRPIDKIGAPLNMTSDEPGRNMFASWVVVPKNCTMNLTLSWYVPPTGHEPYSLVIQRQSSTLPDLEVNVTPAPGTCGSTKADDLHYAHVQDGEDLNFTVAKAAGGSCSLQVKPTP